MILTAELLKKAKAVSGSAPLCTEDKNRALRAMADALIKNSDEIAIIEKTLNKMSARLSNYIEKEYPYLYKLVLDDIPFDIVQGSDTLDCEQVTSKKQTEN